MSKRNPSHLFQVVFLILATSSPSWAKDSPKIKVSDLSTQDDTSILIKKGANALGPDYEIISESNSGDNEITGDPAAGVQESYSSWKTACADWKKEMKELNKENQILSLNCGRASSTRDANGLVTQHSNGTYKLKVRIRGGKTKE